MYDKQHGTNVPFPSIFLSKSDYTLVIVSYLSASETNTIILALLRDRKLTAYTSCNGTLCTVLI